MLYLDDASWDSVTCGINFNISHGGELDSRVHCRDACNHSAGVLCLSNRYDTFGRVTTVYIGLIVKSVDNEVVSKISKGLMVLVGIGTGKSAASNLC